MAIPAVATFILLAAVAFDGGGYFPGPWGWTIALAAWAALGALLTNRRVRLGRPSAAVAVLLGAFAAWTALSSIWSLSPTQSMLDAQRVTVYAAVFLAAALWVRRSRERLLTAVWLAIVVVSVWALLTRLVPDRFGVDYVGSGARLSAPVGYWNALGLYAAIGSLVGIALAIEARVRLLRLAAAASVPLLVTTVYFTYSRGAWVSLGCGLAVLIALDARRVRLAAGLAILASISALVVWRASATRSLTVAAPPLARAAHDGHRLAIILLVAAAASAFAARMLSALDDRLVLPAEWHRRARVTTVAVALVAAIAATAAYGSPETIARKGWDAFSAPNAAPTPTLNGRLFSFSGTGRVAHWRIAWREFEAHPLLGTGARTFEIEWYRNRPVPFRVRDAHNLYLQTIAEVGIVGAALLFAALLIPVATGVAARRRPLIAGAAGAYCAFLVHAVVDWDWQLTGVALPVIVLGAVLARAPARTLRWRGRRFALAGAALLALAGLVTIAQRLPLDRLDTAIAKQQWLRAEEDAHRASTLAPWSSEPWLKLGEAELAAGLTPQADEAFRRAVARDGNNWVAWWDLARAARGVERTYALINLRRLNPLARAPSATSR